MIRTYSAALDGLKAIIIEVELALQRSTPQIILTGLPGDVVRESRERISACLNNFGFQIPRMKTVIHLSPATAKKRGSQFDLAIAVALLASENHIPPESIQSSAFLGELSLDGRIQSIDHALSLIDILERDEHIKSIYIPDGNVLQAALLGSLKSRAIQNLGTLIDTLRSDAPLVGIPPFQIESSTKSPFQSHCPTLDDVQGLSLAKRALIIAIAGRHHFLMAGPPGTGKSLLASTAVSLQGHLSQSEFLEVIRVLDLASGASLHGSTPFTRPFRVPHHTSPSASLLGGGSGLIRPGEISLAHHGILFLDELPEFRRDSLEGLREPLQNGCVSIARTGLTELLPARATVIAAMNPCPCGFYWEERSQCTCAPDQIRRYQQRLSGPLLDRFALFVRISNARGPTPTQNQITHALALNQIEAAISKQQFRFENESSETRNGDIQNTHAHPHFKLDPPGIKWSDDMKRRSQISLRRIQHTIKVARTIADIEDSETIHLDHLQEAWSYRCPTSFNLSNA